MKNRAPTNCGVLEVVVVDQGGEFESTFAQEFEDYGIDARITGSLAGWQQSLVERNGVLLCDLWSKVASECHMKGRRHGAGQCARGQRAQF